MFRIRKSLKTKNVKKCKLETNDKKKKRQHIKKKSLTRDEYKNETGKDSQKKKKRKYEQSTKIIDLAWLPYAKYFLYKIES